MFCDMYCFEAILICDMYDRLRTYRLMTYCYVTLRCVTYRYVAAQIQPIKLQYVGVDNQVTFSHWKGVNHY